MKASVYLDKVNPPLVSVHPETLSDGSTVWNLHFYIEGKELDIPCSSEKDADGALTLIAAGLKIATNGEYLVVI